MLRYVARKTQTVLRDMDLIRDLLLKVEENPEMNGTREFMYDNPEDLGIAGRSVDEVAYHIKLLIQEQFLEGSVTAAFPMHIVSSLTWDGHEFLDNIRDQGIWDKTKKRIEGLSSVALKVVASIAEAEVRKHLGLS